VVAQSGWVGGGECLVDRRVDLVNVCGDQVPLKHGDVRQMRVIQGDAGGDAQRHPPVDCAGWLDRGVVWLDQDVEPAVSSLIGCELPVDGVPVALHAHNRPAQLTGLRQRYLGRSGVGELAVCVVVVDEESERGGLRISISTSAFPPANTGRRPV
jgi:hypothetical protein